MRLLLIEDDTDLIRPLTLALKAANFAVDTATDGEQGLFMALTNNYDLILVDYNLPKLSGKEVIGQIRADGRSVPIIMITVRSEVDEKVDLLETGADDYITKPFVLSELLARIKAVLRRPPNWQGRILRFAGLELDPDRFIAAKNGQRLILSGKEFSLLEYLMAHAGRLLSRQEIMEHVWDENADPFSNTIEVHIMKLRQKIENDGRRLIYTVSGRGYKLDEQK
jgi:DNA-binding response OmpR family regulator